MCTFSHFYPCSSAGIDGPEGPGLMETSQGLNIKDTRSVHLSSCQVFQVKVCHLLLLLPLRCCFYSLFIFGLQICLFVMALIASLHQLGGGRGKGIYP